MNPVHSLSPCFFNIHLHILVQSMSRSSKWTVPFSSSNHNFVKISHLSHIYHMPCPSHSHLIGHSNIICKTVQIMKMLLITQFSPASCISLLLHTPQDTFLTHSQFLFYPSCDRDQVSYPLNTTDKTRNLLSLTITFIFPKCTEEKINYNLNGSKYYLTKLQFYFFVN